MKNTDKDLKKQPKLGPWDESRIIIFLLGLFLLIEGILIFTQGQEAYILISSIITISGIILLLFTYFVPFSLSDAPPEQAESEPESEPEIQAEAAEQAEPKTEAEVQTKTAEQAREEPSETLPETLAEAPTELSWRERLNLGLAKTRKGFVGKLKKLVFGKTKIDSDLLEEIEETLYEADVGVQTTQELINFLNKEVEEKEISDPQIIYELLKAQLKDKLIKFSSEPNFNPNGLTVFLIIGVNGVGKTTTIAKLAHNYTSLGKKVILAAGDTFRAAAIDQISIWGERAKVEVIKGDEGGDPGALVFDAIHAAKKRSADLLIVDTAGRMHVKANLMAELKKVQKIIQRETESGPHEVLLVIDATTGQNALQQAKQFNDALSISGLVITKLDGTAKGGVLFAVEEQVNAPVKFIGVGEKMQDLMQFDPEMFLEALFTETKDKEKESDYEVM